jgi:hypothetical protein
MSKPLLVWGRAVVLELKFTDRYPNWFRDLVQIFNLRQCGAAKYADGVTLLHGRLPQHRRMPPQNPDLDWPSKRDVIAHRNVPLIRGLTRCGSRQHPGWDLSGLEITEEGISTEPA